MDIKSFISSLPLTKKYKEVKDTLEFKSNVDLMAELIKEKDEFITQVNKLPEYENSVISYTEEDIIKIRKYTSDNYSKLIVDIISSLDSTNCNISLDDLKRLNKYRLIISSLFNDNLLRPNSIKIFLDNADSKIKDFNKLKESLIEYANDLGKYKDNIVTRQFDCYEPILSNYIITLQTLISSCFIIMNNNDNKLNDELRGVVYSLYTLSDIVTSIYGYENIYGDSNLEPLKSLRYYVEEFKVKESDNKNDEGDTNDNSNESDV